MFRTTRRDLVWSCHQVYTSHCPGMSLVQLLPFHMKILTICTVSNQLPHRAKVMH